jgi:multidrug efflux pump subunit AcrA (membrane-fusion protein)
VFLLTGDLRSVRSVSLVTPRGEGELQIRWMVEDGSEVKEGERLVEFDAARTI